MVVEYTGCVGILERLSFHDVAPVTSGVSDREEDRDISVARPCESLVDPREPIDGVTRVLAEVWAGCIDESVHRRAQHLQFAASGGERLLPMPPVGMDNDVRVLVMERGLGLTHDLTLACRHTAVSVLGPVRDAVEARTAIKDVRVDVLVIELTGPSVQVIRDVVEMLAGCRILAATDEPDPDIGASVIAAGACGLLARTADERTVPDTIRRAAAGELILPATHLAALVDLVRVSKLGQGENKIDALTPRERQVLALLADGRSTQEVSEVLSISVLTVQSHVKNVLAKLGVHSKVEAIRVAWRSGALAMPLGA